MYLYFVPQLPFLLNHSFQIPCGPENCAIKINMNTSANQCKETETCVISKDQICFSPPCLPWGECKPKDAIIAKASAQSQQCIPNEPVFDPNCAKLTLKFEIPKVPLVSFTLDTI